MGDYTGCLKTCTKCGLAKLDTEEFFSRSFDKRRNNFSVKRVCKVCAAAQAKAR